MLTVRQAAEILGVSRQRMYSMIREDGLAVHRDGRGQMLLAEADVERVRDDNSMRLRPADVCRMTGLSWSVLLRMAARGIGPRRHYDGMGRAYYIRNEVEQHMAAQT